MLRIALIASVFVGLAALAAPGANAKIEQIDYATYDAKVTDSKGIATELTDFGYATGVNILMAYRGDADVEIPWRKIRHMEFGDYVDVDRRAPCTVTLKNGKSFSLTIDNIESTRLLSGKGDFGDYRIRVSQVRRVELFRLSHSESEDPQP